MPRLCGFLLVHVLTWLGQNAHGSQIIHGENVPENVMPYMVSVQHNDSHICGGFLVSKEFVLTAAHCRLQIEKKLTVVLGTHNLMKVDSNSRRTIVKTCQHPSYKNPALGNDIMLLKLSKKAPLGKRVNLIKLPSNNKLKDNQKCRVAGWGKTETYGKVAAELKVVDVPIINNKICKEKWKKFKDLPDNVICAGGFNTDKGFCQGDSGGPLVCNNVAVGIVSFNMNKNCEYPNVPNIYTDISKHMKWINKILQKKVC